MNIISAQDFDFSLLQAFVEPWESSCVTLCVKLRKKKREKIYVITDGGPSRASGTAVVSDSPGVPE
ncbi:MAG: hypothetical protein J5726_07880, partial [Treponema sp.]|nr:hypothetical protein [Treponema sp.]